ncbi:GNAT family N-acetyltransferase [Denitratisoma oestradiolicum]|uniref:GNAT family N-acetyltransferase n=1 Tax=Denitratisoma oestradiolicum TaxID=311182 RepID=A0A6S6XQB6_9PROT|nr:GNAT family N-acetyltransferase [Denitratisoma oestradiolicum]TWO79445.1 hypothetical protein CBW56_15005 [Denitratisoma oestradiolicum]CAB1368156.1 GNAT family N-acetyltransferase [Denitratisoma oestradiolicum]
MHSDQHYLTPLFEPRAIAIIGASEKPDSIGATVVRNLLDGGYEGRLHCVNPRHQRIFGLPALASIEAVPERVDVAVICTRAALAPDLVQDCGRAGVRCVVLLSAGFGETGPAGAQLEQATLAAARRHGIRLLGPNCLGLLRPGRNLNLSFAHGGALPGTVALVSQSGALCTAILDWALPNKVGFSAVVSLGAESDIDFGEALDYLVSDPRTECIFLYIEGIRNARRFMSALRAAARIKPVLVIKAGRHPAGEQAVVSHTGARLGDDDVFDAALRRAGVVRLRTLGQMYATASALFFHFHPRGNRLAIITNGGGPGAMAADHAADIGIPLARLSPQTLERLDQALPAFWPRANPIDLIGDANPARYGAALAACLKDDGVDGVLLMLTPQAMSDPTQAARVVIEVSRGQHKPLFTCWMGEEQVREARLLFRGAGIPTFNTPEPAVDMFAHISAYYRNQQLLLQAPAAMSDDHAPPDLDTARQVVEAALTLGQGILDDDSTRALLWAFHIPVGDPAPARHADRALRVGMTRDPVFGPAITLEPGPGSEPGRDRVVALPPLNDFLVADMLGSDTIARRLKHLPTKALTAVLLRLSEMVCELPWLREVVIDPLRVDDQGAVAAGARITIAPLPPRAGPYDHMAIHPYPSQLSFCFRAANGQTVSIRPIRPEDADMEQHFVQGLSNESRYFRFLNSIRELSPAQLVRFTQIDYDREMAFLALADEAGSPREVGVARYAANPDGESCEFAIVVADDWQGTGLGHRLMEILIDTARQRGMSYMTGEFLTENSHMLKFVADLGFTLSHHPDDPGLRCGILDLKAPRSCA